jgi:hypothetical protein
LRRDALGVIQEDSGGARRGVGRGDRAQQGRLGEQVHGRDHRRGNERRLAQILAWSADLGEARGLEGISGRHHRGEQRPLAPRRARRALEQPDRRQPGLAQLGALGEADALDRARLLGVGSSGLGERLRRRLHPGARRAGDDHRADLAPVAHHRRVVLRGAIVLHHREHRQAALGVVAQAEQRRHGGAQIFVAWIEVGVTLRDRPGPREVALVERRPHGRDAHGQVAPVVVTIDQRPAVADRRRRFSHVGRRHRGPELVEDQPL